MLGCVSGVLCCMIFIETPVFTRRAIELLDHDAYLHLQLQLVADPRAGDVIEGSGGVRKIRVAAKGHGKRGGGRVIYYHFVSASRIAMLMIYAKGEKSDLSVQERKILKAAIEHWSHL